MHTNKKNVAPRPAPTQPTGTSNGVLLVDVLIETKFCIRNKSSKTMESVTTSSTIAATVVPTHITAHNKQHWGEKNVTSSPATGPTQVSTPLLLVAMNSLTRRKPHVRCNDTVMTERHHSSLSTTKTAVHPEATPTIVPTTSTYSAGATKHSARHTHARAAK